MEEFEVFDKYHCRVSREFFVTIQKRGNLSLNGGAFEALGKPNFVELLFNRNKRLIGFRPMESNNGRAIPVRKQAKSQCYIIAGVAFAQEYEIDTSVARRYPAKIQDALLIVDLLGPNADATGPRRKGLS